jgi:hypothetical protein
MVSKLERERHHSGHHVFIHILIHTFSEVFFPTLKGFGVSIYCDLIFFIPKFEKSKFCAIAH